MYIKNFTTILLLLFLNFGYSNNPKPTKYKTVYYFTQQTSQKNGKIILSFVKEISCEWGYRGQRSIERVIKEDFKNWFSYKPWSKEFRGNVYVYESRSFAQNARRKVRSLTNVYDDNDRYNDSYKYDCDYHTFLDEEREQQRELEAKKEEERKNKIEKDRILAEQTKIRKEKEEAEEKKRYRNWVNTEQKAFLSKLESWNLNTKKYINEINIKYNVFKGEQLPTYLDIYNLLIERTLLSANIPVEEKSTILQKVLIDTFNYYNLYINHNYNKVVPSEVLKKINSIYLYGKAQFGFHPATNAYSYLSGIYVNTNQNNYSYKVSKFEDKGLAPFYQGRPDIALFDFLSQIENSNWSLEWISDNRPFLNNELQWRINLGYILYYNGYYYDAYKILNNERKHIDRYDKNWKKTNYWELYSFEIASLYYTSNYDIAIKEATKFEEGLSKQYPKMNLKELTSIKITRNKKSLATDDTSIQNAYARVLTFWSKSLLRKNDKKASAKIINPIVKLIKKGINSTYFGNNDHQLSVLIKLHEPKVYDKYILNKYQNNFKRIKQTYDAYEKAATKKTWQEVNETKIAAFLKAYNNKENELAVSIGKELLPSLYTNFEKGNMVYKEIMTKAAIAATSIKDYESGVCFSSYALEYLTTKDDKVAYLLLLTNLILSNNYSYTIDSNNLFKMPKDNNVTYNFESLLTTAAKKNFEGNYGYQILEQVCQELSKNGEKSMYLPYVYNAITKAKIN